MSVIPSAPVQAAGTAPAAAGDRSTGADVTEVFAALVDALTAGLAHGELLVATGDADAGGGSTGEPVAQAPADGEATGWVAPIPGWMLAGAPSAPAAPAVDAGGAAPAVAPHAGLAHGGAVEADQLPGLVDGIVTTPDLADPDAAVDPLPAPVPAAEPEADVAPAPTTDGSIDVADVSPPEGGPHPSTDDAPAGVEAPAAVATGAAPEATPSPAGAAVAGVDATGPAPETSELRATTTPRPAAPPLPEQLVEVIAPLRRAPDGGHRVEIQLRPDELGEVVVDVQVRGNEVNLSLRADLPSTSELLREALADLRAELEAAGFRSGDLDVGSHGPRERTHDRPTTHHGAEATSAPDGDQRPTPATAVSTGLDLRL